MNTVKSAAGIMRLAIAASMAALSLCAWAEPQQSAVSLGEVLFSDKRLSADGTISCASCHAPEQAFGDGRAVAIGINGAAGTRNTPTLLNVADHKVFTWDGRRASVEAQVLDPLTNAREHGFSTMASALDRISGDEPYRAQFAAVFPDGITEKNLAAALGAYVRSLGDGTSRFDRFQEQGDASALEAAARRGLEIFRGRGQCSTCHAMGEGRAKFTDDDFHSVGVGASNLAPVLAQSAQRSMRASAAELNAMVTGDPAIAALGRFNVTRKAADIGKYRTPSLRNAALTAPYMHDGSVATLEDAVDLEVYYRGTQQGRPIVLTPQERSDLVAFLRALTNDSLESTSRNR